MILAASPGNTMEPKCAFSLHEMTSYLTQARIQILESRRQIDRLKQASQALRSTVDDACRVVRQSRTCLRSLSDTCDWYKCAEL